jgi:hypothetical protein
MSRYDSFVKSVKCDFSSELIHFIIDGLNDTHELYFDRGELAHILLEAWAEQE